MSDELSFEKWLDEAEDTEIIKEKIAWIEIKKGTEIFGEKAKNDEPYLLISDGYNSFPIKIPKGMKVTVDDQGVKYTITNRVAFRRAYRNSNCKFRQFVEKYGQTPQPGLEIEIEIDEEGYANLLL